MAQHVAALKGRAAVHAVNDKMEGLLAPLLEVDEDASASSDEDSAYSGLSNHSIISVKVKQTATEMIKTAVAYLGLTVGAAASVGAMVIVPAVAVFIMAGVCLVHAPYAAYKEYHIIKLPSLRSLNNKLQEDANRLEEDVDILTEQIDSLRPEAERAAEVEEELQGIAGEQHCNVDKFVDLVKENDLILSQMRDNLRQRIVQDIFKIVMTSDKNNDGRFCKVETKMLVLKISLQLQEYGVEFDEGKFYKVMSVDPSVARTLTIVKRLIPSLNEDDSSVDSGEGSEDQDEFGEEDAFDMFHMAPDSSISGSVAISSVGNERRLSLSIDRRRKSLDRTSKGSSQPDDDTLPSDVRAKNPRTGEERGTPIVTPERMRKRDFLKRLVK